MNDHTKVESTTRLPGVVTVDNNSVDSVIYTDLTFSLRRRGGAARPRGDAFFTANNLTNETPPATYQVVGRAGVAGPNTYLYDTLGRRYTVGVRVNF